MPVNGHMFPGRHRIGLALPSGQYEPIVHVVQLAEDYALYKG